MRTVAFSLLIVMLVAGSAMAVEETGAPKISARELRYDAGKVKQGAAVSHIFEITNAGTGPLVIESVRPS